MYTFIRLLSENKDLVNSSAAAFGAIIAIQFE